MINLHMQFYVKNYKILVRYIKEDQNTWTDFSYFGLKDSMFCEDVGFLEINELTQSIAGL